MVAVEMTVDATTATIATNTQDLMELEMLIGSQTISSDFIEVNDMPISLDIPTKTVGAFMQCA